MSVRHLDGLDHSTRQGKLEEGREHRDVLGETNSRVFEDAKDTASESPPSFFILGT